ncbi:MAG: hypothetical protein LBD52_09195 [Prevotellaceae bacterium]|nr:hypothetical protein [Prevotellaceae bacterium]
MSVLCGLCCPATLTAQNGVIVSNFLVNDRTITFEVSWKTPMPAVVWSDTVWVFVDYNDAGVMKHLPLLSGSTLTATSAPGTGKVIETPGNNSGVWVVGNARTVGSFSATVKLITANTFFFGACAYAVNYPPMGQYTSATTIKFTGTPKYKIVLESITGGGTSTEYSDNAYTVPAGYTIKSFTDVTGMPGIIKCVPPVVQALKVSAPGFCTGSAGVTFSLSGTQSDANYQLYRNGTTVGAVLPGTGNAATFSSAFNIAGTYIARSVAGGIYCPAGMSGTHAVNVIPLPAAPTAPSRNSRCSAGIVTFSATAPSGCTIDWYNAASGGSIVSGGNGVTSFSPNIKSTTTLLCAGTEYLHRLRIGVAAGACQVRMNYYVCTIIDLHCQVVTIILGTRAQRNAAPRW